MFLVVSNICFYVSIYWECHNPNSQLTHIFQRGRSTTNQKSTCSWCFLFNKHLNFLIRWSINHSSTCFIMVSRTNSASFRSTGFDPAASKNGSGLNNFSLSLLAVSLNMIIRPWSLCGRCAVVFWVFERWLFHDPGSFERRHMMEIDMGFRL